MPGFDNGVMFADNVDFSGSGVSTGNASVLLNGQLLIGSTVAPHIRVATLTSTDASVSITNGNGTINLSVLPPSGSSWRGGVSSWVEFAGNIQLAVNTGYFIAAGGYAEGTLPLTAAIGDCIRIGPLNQGAEVWRIKQNAGQQIQVGTNLTTIGVTGNVQSLNNAGGDCLELICMVGGTNTFWIAMSGWGSVAVT